MAFQLPETKGTVGHRTMAEAALARLREAIVLGELAPGAPLPLAELARALGMSSSPVREAVGRLEALGLVERVPHRLARVVAVDFEELRELFAIRLTLESLAVRRAAQLFTSAHEKRGRACLSACATARRGGELREALEAHAAFHLGLYEAAGSAWLLRLIRPVWDSCERYRGALLSGSGELQERHQRLDEELLAACVAHEPERAASTLRSHLDLATDFYSVELQGRSIFAFR